MPTSRRLNIHNIFDKNCYNAIAGSITFPGNVHGKPRNVMLSMNDRL